MADAIFYSTALIGLLFMLAISRIDKNTKKTAEECKRLVGLMDRFLTLVHQQQNPPR